MSQAEVTNWIKGVKNGSWVKYNTNAKVLQKSNYVSGQLHGLSTTNHPSGKKKVTGSYKKGLKNGKWFYFAESGVQEKMEIYEFGDLIETKTKFEQ